MLISVCSIKRLQSAGERLRQRRDIAAVLCSSFEVKEENFRWLREKIVLRFEDTANAGSERAFSPEMALSIKSFVDEHKDASGMYICCDSGESRSSAIAAATYRYLNRDEMIIWKDPQYHPNTLVYSRMCKAYGLQVSELMTDRLTRISQKAFKDAVKA